LSYEVNFYMLCVTVTCSPVCLLVFYGCNFLCLQGVKQTDHFGFICRDVEVSGPAQYVCYVFQCASESLVSPDLLAAPVVTTLINYSS